MTYQEIKELLSFFLRHEKKKKHLVGKRGKDGEEITGCEKVIDTWVYIQLGKTMK